MRTDNQALSPAQLQQLLSEYQLGGKQRPRGWYPPPEEVEPALRTCKPVKLLSACFYGTHVLIFLNCFMVYSQLTES